MLASLWPTGLAIYLPDRADWKSDCSSTALRQRGRRVRMQRGGRSAGSEREEADTIKIVITLHAPAVGLEPILRHGSSYARASGASSGCRSRLESSSRPVRCVPASGCQRAGTCHRGPLSCTCALPLVPAANLQGESVRARGAARRASSLWRAHGSTSTGVFHGMAAPRISSRNSHKAAPRKSLFHNPESRSTASGKLVPFSPTFA